MLSMFAKKDAHLVVMVNRLLCEHITGARKILEKDLDVIFQIGTSENNFQVGEDIPSFWPKDILQTWIKSNSDITLISEDKNVITGYILSSYHESNKKAVIENLWVHSKYR